MKNKHNEEKDNLKNIKYIIRCLRLRLNYYVSKKIEREREEKKKSIYTYIYTRVNR